MKKLFFIFLIMTIFYVTTINTYAKLSLFGKDDNIFSDDYEEITVTDPIKQEKVIEGKPLRIEEESVAALIGNTPEADEHAKQLNVINVKEPEQLKIDLEIKEPEKIKEMIVNQPETNPVPKKIEELKKQGIDYSNPKSYTSTIIIIFCILLVAGSIMFIRYRASVPKIIGYNHHNHHHYHHHIDLIILLILCISINSTAYTKDITQFGYDNFRTRVSTGSDNFSGYKELFPKPADMPWEKYPLKMDKYSKSQPAVIHPDASDFTTFTIYHLSGDYLYKITVEKNKIKQFIKSATLGQNAPSTSHPTVYNGYVYLGTKNGNFYRFDADNLKGQFWKVGTEIVPAPCASGNLVISGYYGDTSTGGDYNGIAVYDISSNKLTKYRGASGHVTSSGLMVGSTFYFLSDDDKTLGFIYKWEKGSDKLTRIKFKKNSSEGFEGETNELESGGAASLTFFPHSPGNLSSGYLIFLDKAGFFYYYNTTNKMLFMKSFAARENLSKDSNGNIKKFRISYHSPGVEVIDGKVVATVPITRNVWGVGRMYLTQIGGSFSDKPLWSDTGNMASNVGRELTAVFGEDINSGKKYIFYGDAKGNMMVGEISSSGNGINVTRSKGFFADTGYNDGTKNFGSPIRSEISFSNNKLVFSTQDGILHILAPQKDDLSLGDLTIKDSQDKAISAIKRGKQYSFSFPVNSTFNKLKKDREIEFSIKTLDKDKKAISQLYSAPDYTKIDIEENSSKLFPEEFGIGKVQLTIPDDSNAKFLGIYANLESRGDESDYNEGNDLNNILTQQNDTSGDDDGTVIIIPIEDEKNNLIASNFIGGTFDKSLDKIVFSINVKNDSDNQNISFNDVKFKIAFNGEKYYFVNSIASKSAAPNGRQYSFNLPSPRVLGTYPVQVTVNFDENENHNPIEKTYEDNITSGVIGIVENIQPPVLGQGASLNVIASFKDLTDPKTGVWLNNQTAVTRLMTKSGYGIPFVAEVEKFNYIPRPIGNGNWTYYSDFQIKSATAQLNSNMELTNSGLTLIYPQLGYQGYGERIRFMPNPSNTALNKMHIYSKPEQRDGEYTVTATITAFATWKEHYQEWVPPYHNCDVDDKTGRIIGHSNCIQGYWQWKFKENQGTYTGSNTVNITIKGSMFDDDQTVITQ